jgi:adenine-specific DNA-methyltransferase
VSDFEQLRCDGKRIYLFDARQAQQTAVQNYLKHGKGQGVHLKYLTSHRDPWYKIEQRPPAPILVNVFNRAGLRFVRNEAGVHNLTCFHATYPSRFLPDLDLFMAYLLTDVARKILSANRREYGDGLRKYEPNDINNSQVLNLDVLSDEQKQRIHVLYAQYRQSILGKEPDSEIVHQIEQVFLQVMVA